MKTAALALGLALAGGSPAAAAHPNALWRVVHNLCGVDKRLLGLPTPCLAVDLKRGVAVVPDPGDRTQILLVPTRRITGIESPDLLQAEVPNYWQAAWEARRYLNHRAGRKLAREDVALAVNAIAGRSQNQLHIHVDCVRGDVRDALARDGDGFSPHWTVWRGVGARPYRVRIVRGESLEGHDPFQLLAEGDPQAAADMGRETLVAVGAHLPDGEPGFYLLAGRADPDDEGAGHGEEFLDHTCGSAPPPPP